MEIDEGQIDLPLLLVELHDRTLQINTVATIDDSTLRVAGSSQLVLGDNVFVNGGFAVIDLNGWTSNCDEPDAVVVRSTVPGVARTWLLENNPTILVNDVQAQDQHGLGIRADSSTNLGNCTLEFRNCVATDVEPEEVTAAVVRQPYPNPATGTATLQFALPRAGPVRIELFDAAGRRVQGFRHTAHLGAGLRTFEVPLRGVRAGRYWMRVTTPNGDFRHSITILR